VEIPFWTPSYFAASTGGAPIERLREYVEAQEKLS
jgi:REP element-mobilizing transposase RayT